MLTNRIMSYIRKMLPILIAFLALGYAVTDHYGVWDRMTGRTAAFNAWERLTQAEGWPKNHILNDEEIFYPLLDFVSIFIPDDKRSLYINKDRKPSAIARVGGAYSPALYTDLPPEWPDNHKIHNAPQTAPVLFVYNYTRNIAESGKAAEMGATAVYAFSLSELKDWVDKSRDNERFWVSSVLLGVLSMSIAIMEFDKSDKRKI